MVHGAATRSKEDVLDDGHGKGREVHAKRRANQDDSPGAWVGILNLRQAVLGPVVRQVDQQNKAENEEEHRTNQRDVIAPEHKELVRDKEGQDDQSEPSDDLGSPEAVLDFRAWVLGGVDSEEKPSQHEVKQAEGKVDAVDGKPAVAISVSAADLDIVEREVL